MGLLAKIFQVVTMLAALIGAIETIVRLARFAWSLLLNLLKRTPRLWGAPLMFARAFAR